jgi:hypothetical protein
MPAEMLLKLKTGTQLSVVPDYASASAQDAQPARVIRMSPVIDPASGTFEVIAEIQGKGGSLKPGMTANIKLAAAAEKR